MTEISRERIRASPRKRTFGVWSLVRETREKTARGVFTRYKKFARRRLHARKLQRGAPRATKFTLEFFFRSREHTLHASEKRISPETARSESCGSIFKERLRKAKEQEEVIRTRHCYSTLGTLDRNRTWKPTSTAGCCWLLLSSASTVLAFDRVLLSPRRLTVLRDWHAALFMLADSYNFIVPTHGLFTRAMRICRRRNALLPAFVGQKCGFLILSHFA